MLEVRVARQQERTGRFISLTKQRREVWCHPERLESLSRNQGAPDVELIVGPKNRSNRQETINISNSYEELHGPPLESPSGLHFLENARPSGIKELALTS